MPNIVLRMANFSMRGVEYHSELCTVHGVARPKASCLCIEEAISHTCSKGIPKNYTKGQNCGGITESLTINSSFGQSQLNCDFTFNHSLCKGGSAPYLDHIKTGLIEERVPLRFTS